MRCTPLFPTRGLEERSPLAVSVDWQVPLRLPSSTSRRRIRTARSPESTRWPQRCCA